MVNHVLTLTLIVIEFEPKITLFVSAVRAPDTLMFSDGDLGALVGGHQTMAPKARNFGVAP